jgi:hypothetical protein
MHLKISGGNMAFEQDFVAALQARGIGINAPDAPSDTAAIEGLVAAEEQTWDRGDPQAYAAQFAENGSFTNISGATYHESSRR